MIKKWIVALFFLLAATDSFAQNPDGPVAKVIRMVSYNGVTDSVPAGSRALLAAIKRHGGKRVKKLRYSVYVKPEGEPGSYWVASAQRPAAPAGTLRVQCVVYRFYTFDGVRNFFYIDKIIF